MITFDEEMDKLPSERRAKIEAKTQELLQEMQIIDELRQRLGLSSEEITESESEQPCFSAKSDDFKQHLTLENLTRMMSELGGEWELTLKFPEQQVIKLSSERP
ncbi:MAG: transcriptional regulator [Microcystis panniformis Mp_MB_F_20051200_S6D]|nr:MAG: transcriptional regulator [Microcystis panniformis Mp_GB_SS_20050300_S99D]TRV46643.1 MAG: transcriptional regulator [Microcystis panniformis Mp_GB_SS_20050300_S99]TRV47620.1 MAG: transcriptional regulator [Microcystis panniformis Mp_MB_F_20080800_S26D]TRV55206.1 MAG: transcriptional regulator [Microcystis panniformis Mp_MB_F_20051200_S9D]TRV55303.1 MAG: transcriptional regulator [Microcystis panniformis Mp_MB_F_20080800_S26]TRV66983.1 MAG: transcriptional regulator [Microcystis pannifo